MRPFEGNDSNYIATSFVPTHERQEAADGSHAHIGDSAGPTGYANRVRYRARGNANLGRLSMAGQPVYGFVWNELLMPIGGRTQQFTLGQNRATVGIGLPIGARSKAELAYMNLYNAFASRRANEVNHTLWVSWHYTGRRLRP